MMSLLTILALNKRAASATVSPHMRRCLTGLCALLSFVLLVPVEAQAQADLALTKSVSNAAPNVGDTITFTITLTNNGPTATATGVTVIDLLPAGLTFVSATPSQGSYVSATGVWTVGSVSTGTPQTLAISATVVSPSAQSNTASITASSQADPVPGNNSSTITETPQQANLGLTKSVSNATPNVGDTLTFTVTLTNTGPSAATAVTVNDLLPPGLTFVSATPSQGTYNSATGLWSVGTIATSTPQTLAIVATVVSPAPQTNTASISHSDQFDPNAGDNSASVTETPQQANLALSKTASTTIPVIGSNVTFTITLTNSGPSTATAVTVIDLLPAGLTFVSATPSQGSYNSVTGVWTVGSVATGPPQTLAIVATVVASSALTNTATISHSDQFDPNPGNNSATATIVPQAPGSAAELALAKTVSNAAPNVGSTITFTITLTNSGPATATGVTVTDLVPAGLTFVSATPSQGTYVSATGVWTVGTVTTGTPQTLAIVATVVSASALANTATITASGQGDPVPGNNTATVALTPQQANLSLAKTVSSSAPSVGSTITFTVTLTNAGPATATGVAVNDLLPAGLTFVSATPSQGSYNSATGVWTAGTITTAAPLTLSIVATVVGPSAMTNTATISASDQFDPVTANNSASVTVTPPAAVPTLPTVVLILLMGTLAALAVRSLRVRRAGERA
jgi:uncharacterized repeat protein (TIGR01451 family)